RSRGAVEGGGCRRPLFSFFFGLAARFSIGMERASIVRRSFFVPIRPPPVATPRSAYFTARATFLSSARRLDFSRIFFAIIFSDLLLAQFGGRIPGGFLEGKSALCPPGSLV